MKPIDLTGQRFGELIAVHRVPNIGIHTAWLCKCSCGKTTIIKTYNLTKGLTRSCGHLRQQHMIKVNRKNLHWAEKQDMKENTRLSTLTRSLSSRNKSGVKGVSYDQRTKQWIASLVLKGQLVLFKRFNNKIDAIRARKAAEQKYIKPILEKYGYQVRENK